MGLASFNRMRRERAKGEMLEAELFKVHHAARNKARVERVNAHRENKARVEEIRQEDRAASERIGEKVRRGLETRITDEPMRKDHAAEIAGRNLHGVGLPKDPVQRIEERIPQGTTANEKLVENMSAELPGPDPAAVDAARREVGAALPGERRAAPETRVEASVALTERSRVEVPSNWRDMPWPQRRSLATQFSDGPIHNNEEAVAAIEAELRRRG
jgi:hypothetical protein